MDWLLFFYSVYLFQQHVEYSIWLLSCLPVCLFVCYQDISKNLFTEFNEFWVKLGNGQFSSLWWAYYHLTNYKGVISGIWNGMVIIMQNPSKQCLRVVTAWGFVTPATTAQKLVLTQQLCCTKHLCNNTNETFLRAKKIRFFKLIF